LDQGDGAKQEQGAKAGVEQRNHGVVSALHRWFRFIVDTSVFLRFLALLWPGPAFHRPAPREPKGYDEPDGQ